MQTGIMLVDKIAPVMKALRGMQDAEEPASAAATTTAAATAGILKDVESPECRTNPVTEPLCGTTGKKGSNNSRPNCATAAVPDWLEFADSDASGSERQKTEEEEPALPKETKGAWRWNGVDYVYEEGSQAPAAASGAVRTQPKGAAAEPSAKSPRALSAPNSQQSGSMILSPSVVQEEDEDELLFATATTVGPATAMVRSAVDSAADKSIATAAFWREMTGSGSARAEDDVDAPGLARPITSLLPVRSGTVPALRAPMRATDLNIGGAPSGKKAKKTSTAAPLATSPSHEPAAGVAARSVLQSNAARGAATVGSSVQPQVALKDKGSPTAGDWRAKHKMGGNSSDGDVASQEASWKGPAGGAAGRAIDVAPAETGQTNGGWRTKRKFALHGN
jgi:hypothetical protein